MPGDDPEKMARMRRWLQAVSAEVGVPADLVGELEEPLLDLIATVAHGPSRPGAPLTAFLVGVATGGGADPSDVVARIHALAEGYPDTV